MGVFQIIGGRLGVFRQTFELMGISLWIAWVLLVYSGEFYSSTIDFHLHTTLCYLISTTCVSAVFFGVGLRGERAERAVFDNRIVVAGGIAASVGTVGMMVVGQPFGHFALLATSAAITGVGTSAVALRGCLLMGELSARNSFIVSASTLLLAFVVYLAALSLPRPVAAGMLSLLPFAASLHVCLHRSGEELPERVELQRGVSHSLWRITAALFVLAVIFSVSRGVYPAALDVSEFNDSRNYAACGSMMFCMAALVFSLLLPRGTSFGLLGYWMVVAIVFLMTLFPILGVDSAISGVASTIANSALGMTAWALFGAMSSLSRISPLRVYGLGFSAFMFGSAVGWPVGYVVNYEMADVDQHHVGLVLLVVMFLVVLTLFRQGDLTRMAPDSAVGDEMLETNASERVVKGSPLDAFSDAECDGRCGVVSAEGSVVGLIVSEPTSLPPEKPRRLRLGEVGSGRMDVGGTGSAKRGSDRAESGEARLRDLARDRLLTDREVDVFLLLSKGLSARTVSDALGFSYNTARVHVRNIYMKLDVHSRDDLLRLVERCKED